MEKIFISNLTIENVRHLRNISIPLSVGESKHLIFTGRNGCGKTSVLEALSQYLNTIATSDRIEKASYFLKNHEERLKTLQDQNVRTSETIEEEKSVKKYKNELDAIKSGISVKFNQADDRIRYCFEKGQFIIACYKADRVFLADKPLHVEKIKLNDKYLITDRPRKDFVKYLLDIKVTEALAKSKGNYEKAEIISKWFSNFERLLQKIFDDASLQLIFEEDTFSFFIKEENREIFDFNTMSSGFAAVLDIVLDIILRMEKQSNKTFDFNIPGIVLIDEIETHLHLELQKSVLNLLTTVFPNVQFIMSTHSPFVLNSLPNVVIYDLENGVLVENGLSDIPYNGIVEGYFNSSEMSNLLKKKFDRYCHLVKQDTLSDDDFAEIAELEMFLSEIPDYLALNITTEFQRLKLEFEKREDI